MTAPTPQASSSAAGRALLYQGNEVVHVDAATARGAIGPIPASEITNTPAGNIAATNVQTALNELDAEKVKISDVRERLTANRTYYVRTDGNNANNGLSNTAGGAFLTVQMAIDEVSGKLDLGNFDVTIQVADGTYPDVVILKGYAASAGRVTIRGNPTTPANVFFSAASGKTLENIRGTRATYIFNGFKVANTNGYSFFFEGRGIFVEFQNIDFGASFSHIIAGHGAYVTAVGTSNVTGGATVGFWATRQGLLYMSSTTLVYLNSPAFSARHFNASEAGWLDAFGMTFTNGGTVTGKRYEVDGVAGIFTNGGGASYLPGSVAGTVTNGGVYY